MKWEYKTEIIVEKSLDLNLYGLGGWELIAYSERPGVGGLTRTYIFKRPLAKK